MSLTPKEQRAILDGTHPLLIGLERFEVGQTLEVTSRVSVRIDKRNLKRGQVTWDYTVIDFRSMFMRRTPLDREPSKPKRGQEEEDESYAERVAEWRRRRFKPTTATEIEEARIDGNYTRSHTQAVPESEDVVPPEVQNRFSVDARTRRAQQQERSQEAQKAQIRAATEALREKARRGEDLTPYLAHIQRSEHAA